MYKSKQKPPIDFSKRILITLAFTSSVLTVKNLSGPHESDYIIEQ